MLTPAIKHALKVIFVVIVIAGLLASYIFTGVSRPTQTATEESDQSGFNFINPTEQPATANPSGAPAVTGPATPPPTSQ